MARSAKKVANKKSTNVAKVDFEQDAGLGVDFNQEDLAIPFLQVLQKGSPQIDEDHPDFAQWEHLKAKTGQFFNTVTYELFDEVFVIPCGYVPSYVEWKDRQTAGGGWVAQHPIETSLIEQCKRNDKNQDVLPNGNILVQTHYHYCLVVDVDTGKMTPVVVAMSSTQLKKSRRWNTMLSTMTLDGSNGPYIPPIFSHIWRLTTVAESNDKGNWRGYAIEVSQVVDNVAVYQAAKDFYSLIKKGGVRMTPPPEDSAVNTEVTDY